MVHSTRGRPRRSTSDYPDQYRVLLPLANLAEAEALLPLAETLVREQQGELVVLQVVWVSEDRSLSEAATETSHSREALDRFISERGQTDVKIKTLVRVARQVWDGIWETAEQERINLLLLAWRNDTLPQTAVGDLTDPRLAMPPCDVVAVRLAAELTGSAGWQAVRRILLPVRGGPHSAMALRVAQALAEATSARVTLLHEVGQHPREAEEHLFATFAATLRSLKQLSRTVTTLGDVANAIIESGNQHQVVVMGASTRRVPPGSWGGPVLEAVARGISSTLIVVKSHVPPPIPSLEAEPEVYEWQDRPIAVVVDKWFAENTFRSDEFGDLERLLALKEEQGLTVSLGLPALNEEETVGNVIQTVKTSLFDQVPLLDEIVLIDSGSVDRTCQIAADLGIPCVLTEDILPQYGCYRGKGEALWKSLHVLRGDIVAWIDTDIRNIHPRFVYGIVGPLLRDSRVQYVKGFYQRPLRTAEKVVAGGGGRVTELTARPLINLFFPELSGLIQPLAGEYAGRRQALECLPFFTGYGVEMGLLIDLLERFGLQAIAQVDLLKRIHRNQPLLSLSKMSFAIIQVVISRLEGRHRIQLLEELNKTINLIRYRPGHFHLEAIEILEHERPPMISLLEYRQERGLNPDAMSGEGDTRQGTREP
jgi:glycosyltransferase involved in cell wall biosynthesis/nucleotide-binding universal stress UspA family protein/DNA-binding phage protein